MNNYDLISECWDSSTVVEEGIGNIVGSIGLAGLAGFGGYKMGNSSGMKAQTARYNENPAAAAAEIGHVGRANRALDAYKKGGIIATATDKAASKNGWTTDGGKTWHHVPMDLTKTKNVVKTSDSPTGAAINYSTSKNVTRAKNGRMTKTTSASFMPVNAKNYSIKDIK